MLTVIGCGNPTRSDDGVGPWVVRALHDRLGDLALPQVQLFDAGTDGMSVMFRARGTTQLIVIDACRSGSAPGTVYAVPGKELAAPPEASLNLHDFRWNHALHAGRQIYKDAFPEDVTVYLIESETLDYGVGLSAAVERAASDVADRIEELIRNLEPGASA
ncbi:MAG: hydrogenase maturation protease [Dongiaceae bacterium]